MALTACQPLLSCTTLFEYHKFTLTVSLFYCLPLITEVPKTGAQKSLAEFQKATAGVFAACAIASSVVMSPPPADAVLPATFSSSQVLAEKVVREG